MLSMLSRSVVVIYHLWSDRNTRDIPRMSTSRRKSVPQKRSTNVPNAKRAAKRGAQSKEWDRYSRFAPNGKGRLPLGAHPWNTGGKKGRSGRKPNAFKEMCRLLASSDLVWQSVQLILMNPNHPSFNGALKWASENGYGKPAQKIDVRGDIKNPGKLTKEEMREELAKLFTIKEGT